MGENTPHIDNRYSAIYQRGGTGPTAPRTNGAVPATPPAPHIPPTAPEQAAPSARSEDHATADSEANIVEVLPDGAAPATGSPRSARQPVLRINPFIGVLWLLGAGLIGIGLWALFAPMQIDETSVAGPFPQWIFIVSQSAGGVIMSGSILLAAAGVLSGLFWDRRRREAAASAA